MWLFTENGFFSAVEHRDSEDLIVIRARDEADLISLRIRHGLSGKLHPIIKQEGSDYPARIIMHRATWVGVVSTEAANISYGNFKNRVKEVQGEDREHVYHKVWAVMLEVERMAYGPAMTPEQRELFEPPFHEMWSGSGILDHDTLVAFATDTGVCSDTTASRTYSALTRAGYDHLIDLDIAEDDELLSIKGVGDRSLALIRAFMDRTTGREDVGNDT